MNSRYLLVVGLLLPAISGCDGRGSAASDSGGDDSGSDSGTASSFSIVWTAEAGNVVEDASNPGAKMLADGSVALRYQNRGSDHMMTSHRTIGLGEGSDWLEPTGEISLSEKALHAVQLPGGTFRSYGPDPTMGGGIEDFISASSTDGTTFTEDLDESGNPIVRYELQPADNGLMGTFDLVVTTNDDVVLLYVGDNFGLNNIRRAVSTDGGDFFTFDRGNVFGDDDAGGGGNTYVDQDTIRLPDGRIYFVAMKGGRIFHFLGDEDADQFEMLGADPVLNAADFSPAPGVTPVTLHDPQIVMLGDGRLRMYLATIIPGETGPDGGLKHYMVAATGVIQ